jgi:hypothetical protein
MEILDSLDKQYDNFLRIFQGILQPSIASQPEDAPGFVCYHYSSLLQAELPAKA